MERAVGAREEKPSSCYRAGLNLARALRFRRLLLRRLLSPASLHSAHLYAFLPHFTSAAPNILQADDHLGGVPPPRNRVHLALHLRLPL